MIQRRPSSNAAGRRYGPITAAVLVAAYAAVATAPAWAQLLQRAVAIQNARILTMDGAVIQHGTLVFKGERIIALGADVKPPLFSKKIDARGGTLTPGLIDPYSTLGHRSAGAGTASRRAEDAFDRYDTANLLEACRNGVTAIYLSPGRSAGTGGTGAIVRLMRDPARRERVGQVLKSQAALGISLASESSPITRLKTLATLRKQFHDALEYRKSLEDYQDDVAEYEKNLKEWIAKQEKGKDADKDKDEPKELTKDKENDSTPPPSAAAADDEPKEEKPGEKKKPSPKEDSAKEENGKPKRPSRPGRKPHLMVLLKAVDRELPVRIVAHRSEDILNALELAEEFSFDLILEGAAEAHLVADELADAKALVVFGSLARGSVRQDDIYRRAATDATAMLSEAGAGWLVGSGAEDPASARFVAMNSQLATARDGRDVNPLVAVTARAADALQVADQIGRLRPGLLADMVLWSNDPLEPAAAVRQVFVGGVLVYDQADQGGTE